MALEDKSKFTVRGTQVSVTNFNTNHPTVVRTDQY